MDADTFDDWVKRLTATRGDHLGSRRTLLRLVTALPLTSLLATLLTEAGEASGRQKRRKKRHKHHSGDGKRNRKGKHNGQEKGKGKDKPDQPTPAPVSPPPPGCTPTTCAAQGTNCGSIADGCGTQLRCGPDSCGDGYTCTDNRCRCPDGTAVCEGVCCQAGEVCQNGDGACCAPTTCAAADKNCGSIPDGCGGTLTCGDCASEQCLTCGANHTCVSTCTAPETCGGGGTPNQCGCLPLFTCCYEGPGGPPCSNCCGGYTHCTGCAGYCPSTTLCYY